MVKTYMSEDILMHILINTHYIYIYILATTTENSHIILKPFRRKYYINIIII